jgi:hypothetical protein
LLKKWFILLIVLSCTIFAVSSGCSEKSKENVTKDAVENSKESVTTGAVENSKESVTTGAVENSKESVTTGAVENSKGSTSADKVVESEKDLSKDSETETEVSTGSTGNSDNWCSVGSSWNTVNPQTGEEASMKITGIETIDGIPMCKAVYETNTKDEKYSKLEYFWSQDGKTSLWNVYDISGKKISEVSMKEGKMRMVDESGKVTEITQGS